MALVILILVTLLYLGNFSILAHEYMKEPETWETYMRSPFRVTIMHAPIKVGKADKVNWKHEGF